MTPDYLRAYYLRPELHPVEESCDAERRLHAALMDDPWRDVPPAELAAIADRDAAHNYEVVLRFRDRLRAAGTVEGCYQGLFRGDVDIPPLFVDQMAHVVLRNILEGVDDPLRLRAGELFFREQKATVRDGHVLLADAETVEMHASGAAYGSLGRLIVEAKGELATTNLEVLDRQNAAAYWERESRHDTVVSLTYGRPALDAFCRDIEAWIAHFTGIEVAVAPIRAIEEPRWAWHIGLDAESTALLNALWRGEPVEPGRLRRLLALFRLRFADPGEMRADVAGRDVYLGLAMDEGDVVRMKPQNLLLSLPVHEA